jgi:hypothetical protein
LSGEEGVEIGVEEHAALPDLASADQHVTERAGIDVGVEGCERDPQPGGGLAPRAQAGHRLGRRRRFARAAGFRSFCFHGLRKPHDFPAEPFVQRRGPSDETLVRARAAVAPTIHEVAPIFLVA